jgi:hypothetical protein
MWIILMKSGRSLKSEWTGEIRVYPTEARANAALDDLIYQSRDMSLNGWKVVSLF